MPEAIQGCPTDLWATKHYDQIAFNLKLKDGMTVFSEDRQRAGAFNFTDAVYRPEDMETYRHLFADKIAGKTEKQAESYYLSSWRTFQMSDHLPLWVELKIDFSNPYLEKLR